jgi:hypothetical protein
LIEDCRTAAGVGPRFAIQPTGTPAIENALMEFKAEFHAAPSARRIQRYGAIVTVPIKSGRHHCYVRT